MNNEEKILLALEKVQDEMGKMNSRLDTMQDDISEIKEHSEITRSATNSLVEWADTVGVITQVRFPVKKANGE